MFYPTFVIQNVVYGVQFARLTCYFSLPPPPPPSLRWDVRNTKRKKGGKPVSSRTP